MKLFRRIWWIIVILVIAAGGFYYYQTVQAKEQTASSASSLQTVKLTTGEISTSVSATGSVRSNQNTTVSWTVSGKVGKVLVAVGDQVKADQLLASLDTGSLPQTVLEAQQTLVDAQQALEDLQTSKVDMAQAQSDLSTALSDLEDAQHARNQLNYIRGTKDTIASAEANYQMALNSLSKVQELYDRVSGRPENDPVRLNALANLVNAKNTANKALISVNWYKSKPSEEEIATADADLALAQAKYDDALRTYNRLKDGPSAAEIAAAQNKVTAAQNLIDAVNLTAPIAGTITELEMKPGDLVSNGTEALRIDDLTGIYVDLSVSEVDINQVQIGQSATITFDAIPDQTYTGKVAQVGQVGTSSSGVVNYTVTVQITDADQSIKSGMTAAATVITKSHSDALLVPSKSIKTFNNQKTIYVSSNGQVTPVVVETGMVSDSMTEIVSGDVKSGDQVLSNPSTANTTATSSSSQSGFSLFGILGGGGGGPAGGAPAGAPPSGGPASNTSSSGSSSSTGK